ncbi:MAG: quinone-dependent dihydroorotate dehydrogenase [Alphaproteobacteria bacterium]
MPGFYHLFRPLIFKADPETAHHLTLKAMKSGLLPPCCSVSDPALEVKLWGLKFPNPVGLSAGFDKNAEVIGPAFKTGFGFVEAGTVTPKPQPGNPRPRVFRDEKSESVINRLGFPSEGMNVFKSNLESFLDSKHRPPGVLGVNIGMNKNQSEPAKDYTALINMLGPMADYITINISSPNTPGLRDLQQRGPLMDLLGAVMAERKKSCGDHPPPLLVKLAPDLTEEQQEEIAKTILDSGIDGLILSNTTLDRPESLSGDFAAEKGGLSGRPLTAKSTAVIGNFYKLTGGKLPIIGVGGISSGSDAYEKIRAGASLVQLYTSLVFQGPAVANSINQELLALLKKDGFKNVSEAIGTAHKNKNRGSKIVDGAQ